MERVQRRKETRERHPDTERKTQKGKDKEERRGGKKERETERVTPTQTIQRKGARRGSEIPGRTCKEKQKHKDTVLQGKRQNIQRANE